MRPSTKVRETPVLRCTCPPLLQVLRYRWHESPSTVPKLDVSGPCKHQQPPHTDHFFFRVTFHYSSESCPLNSQGYCIHSYQFSFYSFGFSYWICSPFSLLCHYLLFHWITASKIQTCSATSNHQTKQKTPLNPISTLASPPFSVCSHSQTLTVYMVTPFPQFSVLNPSQHGCGNITRPNLLLL